MTSWERRSRREMETVEIMIAMYCAGHHAPSAGGALCPECEALREYARQRVARCPWGPEKPTCLSCPVHCYCPSRREDIRRVMRYSGPRMVFSHPLMAVMHKVDEWRRRPQARPRVRAGSTT